MARLRITTLDWPAVMLHADHEEVCPLDFEPSLNQDGDKKNDGERTAVKRLCTALHEHYPVLAMLLVEAALYANAPHLRQFTDYGWSFVLNLKADAHQSLGKQFAGRQACGQVSQLRRTDVRRVPQHCAWTSGRCRCERAVALRGNDLRYEQTDTQGQVTRWTWVTNLPLRARTVERGMRAGRSRWQMENETFNTLKNQGYHFAHNYGDGTQNLAMVLAVLMFLACTVDQSQQRCGQLFRQVRAGWRTKAKLWESLRSLCKVLLFRTMEALYRQMATLYDIQLQ